MNALSTAATGMQAQQTYLDVIANNLANANTTGFKKNRVEFQDLIYNTLRLPGQSTDKDSSDPVGLQVGRGVRTSATMKQFTVGSLRNTGNSLDLAIEGDGFFTVMRPDGTQAYTRDGALKTDGNGNLVISNGWTLDPSISVPAEATAVAIASDGTVTAEVAGSEEAMNLGQITISRFLNPAGLKSIGSNLYTQTTASGLPYTVTPGEEGTGTLAQGFLEESNINAVEEMTDLIRGQRVYEINSKVVQAADQMYSKIAQIR